jgi:hypothetical protein
LSGKALLNQRWKETHPEGGNRQPESVIITISQALEQSLASAVT